MFKLFKVPGTFFKAVNRSLRIMFWFVAGQTIQLLIQYVAMQLTYTNDELPFCIAAGFIVAVAFYSGMRIAIKESRDEALQQSQYTQKNQQQL